MTPRRVQVLLYAAAPAGDPDAVWTAYHDISARLAGTVGLVRNALLEKVDGSGRFVVLSEWYSMDAFRDWEATAGHRVATAPLRPYQDASGGAAFGIYTVAAEYAG